MLYLYVSWSLTSIFPTCKLGQRPDPGPVRLSCGTYLRPRTRLHKSQNLIGWEAAPQPSHIFSCCSTFDAKRWLHGHLRSKFSMSSSWASSGVLAAQANSLAFAIASISWRRAVSAACGDFSVSLSQACDNRPRFHLPFWDDTWWLSHMTFTHKSTELTETLARQNHKHKGP